MKRNVSVVKLCLYVSECVCSKIIKELPDLVGSGTPYIYVYSWVPVQKDQRMHVVCKHTVVSDSIFPPFAPAQRTQHTRTEAHSTLPCNNHSTSAEHNTTTQCQLSNKLPLTKLGL